MLLLEAQTSHANASGYVPVEVEDAVFDAIRAAVDDGIIVVEADPWGPLMVERVSPDVRDVLAALAVHELAGLSADETSARAMRRASLGAVKRATERLAGKLDARR